MSSSAYINTILKLILLIALIIITLSCRLLAKVGNHYGNFYFRNRSSKEYPSASRPPSTCDFSLYDKLKEFILFGVTHHVSKILELPFLNGCAFVVRPDNDPPKEYLWKTWAELLMKPHLVNMTAELIKDVENKLKHAEKIKDKHANSVTFELGFIAAGIQERFHLMLSLYRKYADLEQFRKETHSVMDLLKAYQIMQGYYNEIRLEKSIFHDIVRKYESTTAGTMPWDIKRNPSKLNAASNPSAPSGPKPQQQLRRQGKWRRPLQN